MTQARCVIILVCCALLPGCGKVREAAQKAKDATELKYIGLAYLNFNDANGGKAPKNAEDLDPYLTDAPSASKGLKDGKYVFIWGIAVMDIAKAGGTADTVIGYEKDAPTQGGSVLFADGSVKRISAEEFKTARKAAPKTP
ncbi:hypothetical protein AYO40_04130 [Planctomycetaceae bacterium SCGC AG-212-D15]|nr:hypothetical protein AYO40_04130 [Planctomycetaceae bacterium SCGC AG-212-D15]